MVIKSEHLPITTLGHDDIRDAVRAINAGVSGLMRWSFLNPGDIDGRWQFLDASNEYARVENTFYGYATLIRYARPHSEVLTTRVESSFYPWPHVYACALRKTPQGDVSVLVVNDHDSEQVELSLKVPALHGRRISIIRTDRTNKHALISDVRAGAKGAAIIDKLPPRSLTVYTSLDYDTLD